MATDAHAASALAWAATALAVLLVAVGALARSAAPVHVAVALLGALLLLRHDLRLLLAPAYGGGLLVIEELATRSIELAGVRMLGRGVMGARAAAAGATAALGACAGALAALAVTGAPERSLALTAVGAAAIVVAFGAIGRLGRRTRAEPPAPAGPPSVHPQRAAALPVEELPNERVV